MRTELRHHVVAFAVELHAPLDYRPGRILEGMRMELDLASRRPAVDENGHHVAPSDGLRVPSDYFRRLNIVERIRLGGTFDRLSHQFLRPGPSAPASLRIVFLR